MYERSYGYKYDEQRDLSTTEIAKLIRKDIKVAISEGLLPDRWKYSVRSEYFSGGSAIRVKVKDCADAWQVCEGIVPGSKHEDELGWTARPCPNVWCKARNDPQYAQGSQEHEVLTEEGQAAKMTLERIHGAYNHDGSDSMTDYYDVNYYGHVDFEDARSAEWRASEKASKAARRKALDEATDRRKVRIHKRDGSSVTHLAVEVDGKVRLLCGAMPRSYSLSLSAAEDAELTCSRCAKRQEKGS